MVEEDISGGPGRDRRLFEPALECHEVILRDAADLVARLIELLEAVLVRLFLSPTSPCLMSIRPLEGLDAFEVAGGNKRHVVEPARGLGQGRRHLPDAGLHVHAGLDHAGLGRLAELDIPQEAGRCPCRPRPSGRPWRCPPRRP